MQYQEPALAVLAGARCEDALRAYEMAACLGALLKGHMGATQAARSAVRTAQAAFAAAALRGAQAVQRSALSLRCRASPSHPMERNPAFCLDDSLDPSIRVEEIRPKEQQAPAGQGIQASAARQWQGGAACATACATAARWCSPLRAPVLLQPLRRRLQTCPAWAGWRGSPPRPAPYARHNWPHSSLTMTLRASQSARKHQRAHACVQGCRECSRRKRVRGLPAAQA